MLKLRKEIAATFISILEDMKTSRNIEPIEDQMLLVYRLNLLSTKLVRFKQLTFPTIEAIPETVNDYINATKIEIADCLDLTVVVNDKHTELKGNTLCLWAYNMCEMRILPKLIGREYVSSNTTDELNKEYSDIMKEIKGNCKNSMEVIANSYSSVAELFNALFQMFYAIVEDLEGYSVFDGIPSLDIDTYFSNNLRDMKEYLKDYLDDEGESKNE